VVAHDPVAMPAAQRVLDSRVTLVPTNYEALERADALVIVTDWNEYRHPDLGRMRTLLARPVIVDGRNLYAPEKLAALGFTYVSIGRPAVGPAVGASSVSAHTMAPATPRATGSGAAVEV
jgi:UDPglucose 6-dehydrogenase